MQERLPVEHFHFPVEKIKAGYYSDAYFLRTEEILNGDNHHPRVLMQVFTREPVVVCGIDECMKTSPSMPCMTATRLSRGKP